MNISRRPVTTCILVTVILLSAVEAGAQSCGANAHEIARQAAGTGFRMTCVCNAGYDRANNQCQQFRLGTDEWEARTGAAFTLGDRLRAAAGQATLLLRGNIHVGALAAEAGRYAEAISTLFYGENKPAKDSALRQLLDDDVGPALTRLASQVQPERKRAGPLAADAVNPDDPEIASKAVADAAVLAGYYVGHGAYAGAVGILEKAVINAPNDRQLRQALTYSGQLKAEQVLRDAASSTATSIAERRRRAAGRIAWKLGLHLIDKGDTAAAEPALRRAQQALSDGGNAEDIKVIEQMLQWIEVGRPFLNVDRRGQFKDRSKADLILDSLEYGEGNIDNSLRFLEEIRRTEPANLAARDALNYVQGLSAGLP